MTDHLGNVTPEDARNNGWVIDHGDPGAWECVCKAHNNDLRIMKSTKRMRVPGGWLYLVTTQINQESSEALAFVPDVSP